MSMTIGKEARENMESALHDWEMIRVNTTQLGRTLRKLLDCCTESDDSASFRAGWVAAMSACGECAIAPELDPAYQVASQDFTND